MVNEKDHPSQSESLEAQSESLRQAVALGTFMEQTIAFFKTANSPPSCYMVLNDVRVRIMSKSSGGLVEGIVTLIDPATRLACISYNQNRVTGSESRKWVSFDETDPKLMVAGPETSLALPPSERIESFVDDTRRRIEGQAAIPVVTRGSLRMYQDKGYPEITSVYELALQATVIITSKSQGKDVVAVADLVTEDLQRCRVVYGGSYKWVPVTQTKPQLSVHRGVMPEDQK